MITLSDQLKLANVLPLDPRLSNVSISGSNIIIDTINEYLVRVPDENRYLGMEVYILSPAGTYEINSFINLVNTEQITFVKYHFNTAINDSGFEQMLNLVIDNLDSTSTIDALSANQGRVLKEMMSSFVTVETDPIFTAWLNSTPPAYPGDIPTSLSELTEDSTHRTVTDIEKSYWNGKSDSNHTHTGVYEPANTNIQSHISNQSNPHNVTKTQVGLSNVDNTSDINKPISSATQTALNLKADKVVGGTSGNFAGLDLNGNLQDSGKKASDFDVAGAASTVQGNLTTHVNNTNNPHSVTKTQVGLSNVPNIDATIAANIIQDSTHRFTTDAEKITWNSKQNSLGFTPENIANKVTSFQATPDNTHYPSEKLVKDALDGKQPVGTYSTDIHSNIAALNAVSGINTGDQDLSGYSLTTHNHNGVYAPVLGPDDNYVTDAEKLALHTHSNKTALDAVSGINTGDNSPNSLYSGLATSKQDTLVSGTNIKTINGQTVLGAGDISIAGVGGDVVGPSSAIDGNVVLFNGISGKIIKDSGLTLSGTNTGDETQSTILSKLGYTPENQANKENITLDTSSIKYPTNNLVKLYADAGDRRLSTGCLTMPVLTDNGNGTATISSVQVNIFTTSDFSGNMLTFTVPQATLSFTDKAEEYVSVRYNGGSPIYYKETIGGDMNHSDILPIFVIWRLGTVIHSLNFDSLGVGLANKAQSAAYHTKLYEISSDGGLVISETTTPNPRTINVTAAIVYTGVIHQDVNTFNSSIDQMTFVYHVGGVWTYTDNLVYNNTSYDNGTNLVNINNNKYAVRWYYRSIGDTKQLFYVCGSAGNYNSIAEASYEKPRTDLPIILKHHCILIGRSIIQYNATNGYTESLIGESYTFSGVINHDDTANKSLAGTGVTWGHIDDQPQTIYGVKTFNSSPVVPTATTSGQAVNKGQLDLKANQSALTAWKNPTGFNNPSGITVTYNYANRTITLSGDLSYSWNGIQSSLTSPWTSTAHTNTTGKWYLLSTDGTNFTWSNAIWEFYHMMVASVTYNSASSTNVFANRECHGLMNWESHKTLHYQVGTYRLPGTGQVTPGTYVENTATDAANSPGFEVATVIDEDLETVIPAWIEGSYTLMYVNSTNNTSTYVLNSTLPFIATANTFIQVNNTTTGTMTAGINTRWYNVYQILLPTTSDTNSQLFRTVILQPQATFTSLASAQAEDVRTLYLGELTATSPEYVFCTRITYVTANGDTNIGKCRIATGGISYITGSRASQVTISGSSPSSHSALSNLTWTLSGHLGGANTLAAFNASGIATEIPTSTYYLASNPSNYIALTNLSSTATGLTYTNTTGIFSLTSGYSIPTTTSQSNWDTAYSNRIATFTTNGNSGSATFSGNTLNIPTYTLNGLGGITLASLSSTATGLSYSNSTGVFSLTTGYIIPTTTSTGNWDTAYSKRLSSASLSTTTLTLTLGDSSTVTASVPTWNQNTSGSAGSVTNSLIIKSDSGTTEGTDLYTFNGSVAKTLNLLSGTNVTLTEGIGSITFSSPNLSLGTTIGTGNAVTDVSVNGHQITLTKGSNFYLDSNPNGYTTNTGTVTSIVAGTGLSGGTITTSGTISVNYGTTSTTACAGDDSRLSNVRTAAPNLGSNLALNSYNLDFTASLGANTTYSGIIETGTVGENVVFGDILYLKFSDGKWWKAKADAYTTTPGVRMALASISANASGVLLIEGNVRYDSWSLAANKVYLSAATAGALTTTQPSTTGNQIQVLGVAKTSTTMYFKPSYDVGEK